MLTATHRYVAHSLRHAYMQSLPYGSARGQVTVYYDPDAAVLRGRLETWVRGCWIRVFRNLKQFRWAHAQCFLPELMRPVLPGGIGLPRASVQARATFP